MSECLIAHKLVFIGPRRTGTTTIYKVLCDAGIINAKKEVLGRHRSLKSIKKRIDSQDIIIEPSLFGCEEFLEVLKKYNEPIGIVITTRNPDSRLASDLRYHFFKRRLSDRKTIECFKQSACVGWVKKLRLLADIKDNIGVACLDMADKRTVNLWFANNFGLSSLHIPTENSSEDIPKISQPFSYLALFIPRHLKKVLKKYLLSVFGAQDLNGLKDKDLRLMESLLDTVNPPMFEELYGPLITARRFVYRWDSR